MKTLRNILIAIVAIFAIGTIIGYVRLSEAAFYPAQLQSARLFTSISSSATSIRVKGLKDLSGNTYTMQGAIQYGTLSPGISGREESISFTGVTDNGDTTVTLTGVTRGLLGKFPYGTGGTARAHDANSFFVISNTADFYTQFGIKQNTETISAVWSFSSTSVPRYDQVPAQHSSGGAVSGPSEFASLEYVNRVASSGSPDADQNTQGLVQIATAEQIKRSTATGTQAMLVVPAKAASTTWNRNTASGTIPVAGSDGYLDQGWVNKADNSWVHGSTTATSSLTVGTAGQRFATSTFNGPTLGANLYMTSLASTTITGATTPQPVFLATSTNSLVLSGVLATTTDFLGFAVTSASNGGSTTVQIEGIVPGFSGLTKGAQYYVTATGTIGTTQSTGLFVGYAISSTELLINRGPNASWQYIGQSTGVANACGSITCVASNTVPRLARFVVTVVEFAGSQQCTGANTGLVRANTTLIAGSLTSVNASPAIRCNTLSQLGLNTYDLVTTLADGFVTNTITSSTGGGSNVWTMNSATAYFYR